MWSVSTDPGPPVFLARSLLSHQRSPEAPRSSKREVTAGAVSASSTAVGASTSHSAGSRASGPLTSARTCPHLHLPTLAHTCPHPLTPTHTHTCPHLHLLTPAHTSTRPHPPIPTHTCPHLLTPAHTHPHLPTPAHTHTHPHLLTLVHTSTCPRLPTPAHTRSQSPTPTPAHTRPHLPTPTHIHSYPHLPTPPPAHTRLHLPTPTHTCPHPHLHVHAEYRQRTPALHTWTRLFWTLGFCLLFTHVLCRLDASDGHSSLLQNYYKDPRGVSDCSFPCRDRGLWTFSGAACAHRCPECHMAASSHHRQLLWSSVLRQRPAQAARGPPSTHLRSPGCSGGHPTSQTSPSSTPSPSWADYPVHQRE